MSTGACNKSTVRLWQGMACSSLSVNFSFGMQQIKSQIGTNRAECILPLFLCKISSPMRMLPVCCKSLGNKSSVSIGAISARTPPNHLPGKLPLKLEAPHISPPLPRAVSKLIDLCLIGEDAFRASTKKNKDLQCKAVNCTNIFQISPFVVCFKWSVGHIERRRTKSCMHKAGQLHPGIRRHFPKGVFESWRRPLRDCVALES